MTTVMDGSTGITTDGVTIGTTPAQKILLSTAQATTSGTSIDFNSIPSWAKKITVMFNGVSTNGTSPIVTRLGTSGGIQATGYNGVYANLYNGGTVASANLSTGFQDAGSLASNVRHGLITLTLLDSSTGIWTAFGAVGLSDVTGLLPMAGSKTLSGTLDRIRITTVGGTDTFDAGSINILIEG